MNKTVVIGQPVRESGIPAPAALSQNQLIAAGMRAGVIVDVFQQYSNWLEEARNTIVRQALNSKATHLMFIDADVVVPPNLIIELFKMNVPIASGLYFSRIPPYKPIIYNQGPKKADGTNTYSITDYPKDSIIEAGLVGMGACLIDCKFLMDMYRTYNGDGKWFAFEPGRGEDVWFCNRARKMGVIPKVNTGLICGHVAQIIVIDDHFTLSGKDANRILRESTYPYHRVMGKEKSCLT
jgi:hypothetical protein